MYPRCPFCEDSKKAHLKDSIKIKDLEQQLFEAHEVIRFYGDNDNIIVDNGVISYEEDKCINGLSGKKAREYMSKWGVE